MGFMYNLWWFLFFWIFSANVRSVGKFVPFASACSYLVSKSRVMFQKDWQSILFCFLPFVAVFFTDGLLSVAKDVYSCHKKFFRYMVLITCRALKKSHSHSFRLLEVRNDFVFQGEQRDERRFGRAFGLSVLLPQKVGKHWKPRGSQCLPNNIVMQ